MWDQDTDGIDDRLTDTAVNGILNAYEDNDPDGRLRFEVELVGSILQCGGYVLYDHSPTPADSVNLTLLGAEVVTRFTTVPYIRIRALYPSLPLIKLRPEVIRIEAVSILYTLNWKEGHALGVRRGYGAPFPTLEEGPNPTGQGVIVAILDTGINDSPQGSYPGHADLSGKVLGGAWFAGAGPAGYTPPNGSVNPSQSALGILSYHASHLAGTIAGASRNRTFGGIAPDVRFVDVKVLDDNGTGNGLAEGLEWCIRNRNRNWGGGASGIDILNLSLSGTDASDGQDCVSTLVNTAVAEGLVVVASTGNDAACGFLSSPGAADGAITVGAIDPGVVSDGADDTLAGFSNEGPRVSDGDGSLLDEMKPDVTAPGVNVISASGSPVESGYHYVAASGTSMSTALVSGVAALLLDANPALAPSDVRRILHDTAVRHNGSPHPCSGGSDPFGLDSRYHTGWGYGSVDAYAAWEEATHASGTQFVRLKVEWDDGSGTVGITWSTQRELHLTGFHVQRAPDVAGSPGLFATVTSVPVPAIGPGTLAGTNRTTYTYDDPAPVGGIFWYRLITTGGAPVDVSPPKSVRTEAPVGLAVVTLSHNTPETDLTVTVGSGLYPPSPEWSKGLTRYDAVAATLPNPQTAADDNIRYTLVKPLYAGDGAGAHLPPSTSHPWFLNALESGDPARSGALNAFEIDTGAGNFVSDTPTPKATTEGGATALWIPEAALSGVEDDTRSFAVPALSARPNPFRGTTRIQLRLDATERVRLSVLDVQGREVKVILDQVLSPGDYGYGWDGGDNRGRTRAAGHYYLRLARRGGNQVIPLVYLD
jgi:subtilisin family serine protease